MKQEENLKQLLLKDLCGRLPYGVYVKTKRFSFPIQLRYVSLDTIPNVKPYLRPMSSMTKKEKEEYDSLINGKCYQEDEELITNCVDWLNANYFDYRSLIEKKLALEAEEWMYEEVN